jgi:tetratricopeptide (TPR) repeat protein
MKKIGAVRFFALLAMLLLLELARSPLSYAATQCDPWVAKMVSVQGTVEVRRAGQTQLMPARLNDLYCGGDQVQVGERSRADIALINQPVVRLDQNTTITFGGVKENRTSLLDLIKGTLYFFSRFPRNLDIRTAFYNAGVEGTEGLIITDADRSLITIYEGRVLASNPFGSLTLVSGQSAVAERGRAPMLTVVVRPRDAVQWALYYPPTLNFRAEEFQPGPGWQGMVRNSIESYMQGDFQAAFENIKGVPDTVGEPRFFAYRASLLLAVGRVDEATTDIDRALSLNPSYGDAFALYSIIAVAQNDKERARDLAQGAVTADLKSASALIALSYAQQANFDLEAALSSLQRAAQLSPDNALAWARLAEIWLSFAQLSEALEAAKKAVELNPNLSRTQTVLGFAFLTQVDTAEAKKAFERAIELDQVDPLPRVGLGLAKIREGDLQEGRREIEIAVSLDPDNALIRSYLGKAYFEEKRDEQSAEQYEMSKQLDPKDPTPYFYDAIRKQTTNRPIEALQDMQKAIELNDNRAVYRSRLLLDSDLAARSAALGRIYSDLGFQQLGLVEGWKSVNTDPTNFSAHRFLADSYSVLPRHEIARVSQLLQSQLLQPLNTTPIQPSLAESNLPLISAGGPSGLSFNEFNPLFNRNGINFQTTGLGGEHNTYAGEGILSGIYKNASFSVGGFHFQTGGWRKNADQTENIGNAFLQFELSPNTSVQAEYRARDSNRGDLQQNFFPSDFSPNLRQDEDTQAYRAGVRHSFSPNSIVLGSFMYQHQDTRFDDSLSAPTIDINGKSPSKGFSAELQHLFRSRFISTIGGVGYFNVDQEQRIGLNIPAIPISLKFTNDLDASHTNVYLYSYISPSNKVTFTMGASGDFFKTDNAQSESRNQFNPKFGVTWNMAPDTILRAAAFRVLKRTLITNQTLEPTEVAGFNQFYDDRPSTESWRYGAGIDHKLTDTLFSGTEFSRRDLKAPQSLVSPIAELKREKASEYLGRAYLLWAPHPWLALSAEYQYEQFRNDDPNPVHFKKLDTHRVPATLRFFHPSGFSASFRATYFNQSGVFARQGQIANLTSGQDDFLVFDAALNYRLPRRYGIITIGAANLFDKHFKYQSSSSLAATTGIPTIGTLDFGSANATVQPSRTVFARFTLAFP